MIAYLFARIILQILAAIYGGEVRCYEDLSVCWIGGDWHTDATIAIHLDNSWRE